MTNLEIILLFSLCFMIGAIAILFFVNNRLEKMCKHLLEMNTNLLAEMIKLSEFETTDKTPFDEFKGENH